MKRRQQQWEEDAADIRAPEIRTMELQTSGGHK